MNLMLIRKCIGFLLNITPNLKQLHLFISFFTLVFLSILPHISLPTVVLIVPGTVRVVVMSLSLQSSTLLFHESVLFFDAPTVWNIFPDEIRASPSLSFRKQLKTYLFTKAYPP